MHKGEGGKGEMKAEEHSRLKGKNILIGPEVRKRLALRKIKN